MAINLLTLLQTDAVDRTAIIVAESGETRSFGALVEQVEDVAGRLRAHGVARHDRVGIVVPDGPDFIVLLLAVNAVGAAAAPLNSAYTRDEFRFYLDDLKPRFLLLPEGDMQPARDAATSAIEIIDVADGPKLLGLHAVTSFEGAQPDDVALLLHTSGTTSRPKQVPLTHRNLAASAATIVDFYELSPDDVSYCAMPLFHVHGLVASVFSALAAGGSVVIPRRFKPHAFWDQAREHDVTWFSAGPTLHQMILGRQGSAGTIPSLRFVRSCSSALPAALMEQIEETLGVPVVEAYGMTEASHQMASNPLPPRERHAGSVGVPTGVEMKIFDASGAECPPGSAGEVVIRGAGVMSGYLNDPEANEASFFDTWFRTGDRGRFDGAYLRLEGRLKEMILRGGENLSPYEIEAVLKAHPAVEDAVCFGVDDNKYGEKVGAAIVTSAAVDEQTIKRWCAERLAAFKVPETIRFVDEIPRTATGKVQRKRVGQLVLAEAR